MSPNTQKLQKLIYGATGKIYASTIEEINTALKSTFKDIFIFRETFGTKKKLEPYTTKEWTAILAQYSITYGWQDTFNSLTNRKAAEVLSEYLSGVNKDTIEVETNTEFLVMGEPEFQEYARSILESKIPLRQHQIEILENIKWTTLRLENVKYQIRDIKALLQNIKYKQGAEVFFSNTQEVQKFILNNMLVSQGDKDFSRQITNDMLKVNGDINKLHIPTKAKKLILQNLDKIANKQKNYGVENLLSHENWWKRVFKHIAWTGHKKMSQRYPDYMKMLSKIYEEDRSWTFNGRYQASLDSLDYDAAIKVLQEKPNLLLRNMVMFCKYTKGRQVASTKIQDPMQKVLNGKQDKIVQKDAKEWIKENLLEFLIETEPSFKNIWQLVEELDLDIHTKPIHERVVQGVTKQYTIPVPSIDVKLRDSAIATLIEYVRQIKQDKNISLGKVFIDKEALKNKAIQYSGANSDDIQMSGTYLSEGSKVDLPNKGIIRLGCCWKDVGNGSADIDLSTTLYGEDKSYNCYYGSPQLQDRNGDIIAVSSGDITSSGTGVYSAEFIDVDIKLAKEAQIQKLFNSLIVYSGRNGLLSHDAHIFMSVINKKDRVMGGQKTQIDLAKQDYAVKLSEDTKAYLGFMFDIVKNKAEVLSMPLNSQINATMSQPEFEKIIQNRPKRLSTWKVIKNTIAKNQRIDNKEDADLTIGGDDTYDININTNQEKLLEILF